MKRQPKSETTATPNRTHLESLVSELRALEERLQQGGGADKIERQHSQGKLTARERIARLLDPNTHF
ncbi:MAG TPA: acyl-CoA carboxylase subunit beta, partial [Blastocatellia bacterium]|nr:acyl-CoA carboxylase subunit beta [Blastocatellia bacterium]